jgi:very-short-patch-repair endonuclease
LFRFLAEAEAAKYRTVLSTDTYRRDGQQIIWLDSVPSHDAVRIGASADQTDGADQVLSVGRVARAAQDQPARALYNDLFTMRVTAEAHADDMELVVGVGLARLRLADGAEVARHLLTSPLTISFDEASGELRLAAAGGGFSLETDMLHLTELAGATVSDAVRAAIAEYTGHALGGPEIGGLVRPVVHGIDPEGEYRDAWSKPPLADHLSVSFCPAIILRRRSRAGIGRILSSVADQLETMAEVPEGLLPLVDPDFVPQVNGATAPGASVVIDDEIFLPMPVNGRQLEVVKRVDASAQTLVQGPPGTGKTHTAAVLISHLLAQGKRVLVTAQTDRALAEVREKLPDKIRPLSVAVVGSSRSDLADLRIAVDRISTRAAEHDPAQSRAAEAALLGQIDQLRRQRAATINQLTEARQAEIEKYTLGDEPVTLAQLARDNADEAELHDWLTALGEPLDLAGDPSPLTNAEALELLALARQPEIAEGLTTSPARPLPDEGIMEPAAFASACDRVREAQAQVAALEAAAGHPAISRLRELDQVQCSSARDLIESVSREGARLQQGAAPWLTEALADIRAGRAQTWAARRQQLYELVSQAQPRMAELGNLASVVIATQDHGRILALTRSVLDHLANGRTIKTAADGMPQLGALTPRVIKEAGELFQSVRVGGLPPTSTGALRQVELAVELEQLLGALDRAWPASVAVPQEDTYGEWLQWHMTEFQRLDQALAFAGRIGQAIGLFASLGLPPVDWARDSALAEYLAAVRLVEAEADRAQATQPLDALSGLLRDLAEDGSCPGGIVQLLEAVTAGDAGLYRTAHEDLARHQEIDARRERLRGLHGRLRAAFPELAQALCETAADPTWDVRAAALEEGWTWARMRDWLRNQGQVDANALQARLSGTEAQLRQAVEELAANRAWGHALGADRVTGQTKADLGEYMQLVGRLGKGTGKYADLRRAEIRQAMERCRPAVPVWIMPLYRIAEQFATVTRDMFDVVIVDEASQAGLEATFLQYIAPRIVVIGDDKQVSPAAVGLDGGRIRALADQHLADDRYKSAWQDPRRSLFDLSRQRFGGQITLTEHRRCMPEIIAFSNRIAYEPAGIRLEPVRQYGSDRLPPVQAVHVAEGYESGGVNRPEALAIVDQLTRCLADPRYDGRTFGVVSLLGAKQARFIQRLLLERLQPEEIEARSIRCGDSSDFQGSERDVMFLSLVKAPEPGRRIAAVTAESYVQRYNVAASRAKDQMWLFHSATLDQLSGRNGDLRWALLDHCQNVMALEGSGALTGGLALVSEDAPDLRFDSLLEQRVFNRIRERGFDVRPQVEALGYRIDLVVQGASARLAVECDGDHWHGPDAYARDLSRQRDLERCGWRFFRIRESAFYADQAAVLSELWGLLEGLGIRPLASVAAATQVGSAGSVSEVGADRSGSTSRSASQAGSEPELMEQTHDAVWSASPVPQAPDDPLPAWLDDPSVAAPVPVAVPALAGPALAAPTLAEPESQPAQPEMSPVHFRPDSAEAEPESPPEMGRVGFWPDSAWALSPESAPVPSVAVTEAPDRTVAGFILARIAAGPVARQELLRSWAAECGALNIGRSLARELDAALGELTAAGRVLAEDMTHADGTKDARISVAAIPASSLPAPGVVPAPGSAGPDPSPSVEGAETQTLASASGAEPAPGASRAAFTGNVPPVGSVAREEVARGLLQLVEVDGPMAVRRLFTVYAQASGEQEVGRRAARELGQALTLACDEGWLVVDAPPAGSQAADQTVRMPSAFHAPSMLRA